MFCSLKQEQIMLKYSESTACTVLQKANLSCNFHSEGRLLRTAKKHSEVSFQYVLKYLSETLITHMSKIHVFYFFSSFDSKTR